MVTKHDFVVVGAGAAGCVLAARLSQNPACSVLLLEAGPDFPDFDSMPRSLRVDTDQVTQDPAYLWSYDVTLTRERKAPAKVTRGKVVGGSSAINSSVFLRGLPEDYDLWGSPKWDFKTVLSYFKKLETDLDFHDEFHGTEGPIRVWRHPRADWTSAQEAFYQAVQALGLPEYPDLNNPTGTGVGPMPMNNPGGIRLSTALAYLQPSRGRPNLTIQADSFVTRVTLKGDRAVGVEGFMNGQPFVARGEEVILSAGTFGSPQLLMLSGVGPADDLRTFGIHVAEDLPGVGLNMRCHPRVLTGVRLGPEYAQKPDDPRIQTMLAYTSAESADRNDMQIVPLPIGAAMSFNCGIRLASSSGEVRLRSGDPTIQPSIDYGYLESRDRSRLREGLQIILDLLDQPPLRRMVAEQLGPSRDLIASDTEFDRWVLENVSTAAHATGTCKLGPASDESAVVDEDCKVHGLKALRVIDLSIAPHSVRAGTHSTAIMIGERAADLVLKSTWN